jgi:plastocyanin
MHRRYLPLAAVLGVTVAVLPTVASFATEPIIVPAGGGYGYPFYWNPSTAEVSSGGSVTFQNTSSSVEHGVVWTSGPETPSCPGVPVNEGKISWKGTCAFTHPGVYMFHCYVHPKEMTGTITVNANGTTTPTTTTTTTPTTPLERPSGSPLVGSPSLRSSQRGGSVKGTLDISKAGAGDRLEIDLLAKGASLARTRRPAQVRVGRLVRGSVSSGATSFSVKLNAKARRALKRHRRLALTVKITLTPHNGESLTITRVVVEHA